MVRSKFMSLLNSLLILNTAIQSKSWKSLEWPGLVLKTKKIDNTACIVLLMNTDKILEYFD